MLDFLKKYLEQKDLSPEIDSYNQALAQQSFPQLKSMLGSTAHDPALQQQMLDQDEAKRREKQRIEGLLTLPPNLNK